MAIDNNHVLKLGQFKQILDSLNTKTDLRYFKAAEAGALASLNEVAEANLASALASKINAKAEASDLTTLDGKVTTLIGSDTNKSVRTIANEELVAQLVPASAKEALDTLAEIAAWIQQHPDDAAAINAKLQLGTYDDEGTQKEYATVKAYVEAYVASQISDAELSGSDAIQIDNNVVSLIVDTANAHGLSITSAGLQLAEATTSAAGAMSAADKAKLDTADVTAYTGDGAINVSNHVISVAEATQSAPGTMSAADKVKLDGIEFATAAEVQEIIDGIFPAA